MSLFKKIANYCRASNDKAFKSSNAYMELSAINERREAEELKKRKFCINCRYYYETKCNRYADRRFYVSEPDNTYCDEFADNSTWF